MTITVNRLVPEELTLSSITRIEVTHQPVYRKKPDGWFVFHKLEIHCTVYGEPDWSIEVSRADAKRILKALADTERIIKLSRETKEYSKPLKHPSEAEPSRIVKGVNWGYEILPPSASSLTKTSPRISRYIRKSKSDQLTSP